LGNGNPDTGISMPNRTEFFNTKAAKVTKKRVRPDEQDCAGADASAMRPHLRLDEHDGLRTGRNSRNVLIATPTFIELDWPTDLQDIFSAGKFRYRKIQACFVKEQRLSRDIIPT
jgi:hypothetical protein